MRRVLVFQHVAFEPLGTLLPVLRSYGLRIRYVNFEREPDARPNVDGYDGLVVLGGPMSAYDDGAHPHLAAEVDAIRGALDRDLPVLGICLGAQLLARALGAEVRPADAQEIGWYDVSLTAAGRTDPVLGAFAPTERVFQWHGDTFDVPGGAVHLARGDCPSQAFRFGERAYGLQFHLEVDARLIERWLRVPAHRAELEALRSAGADIDAIRRETERRIARARRLSDETFSRFLERFGDRPRRGPHPHR